MRKHIAHCVHGYRPVSMHVMCLHIGKICIHACNVFYALETKQQPPSQYDSSFFTVHGEYRRL